MLDFLPETPIVIPSDCPGCRPDRGYGEDVTTSWCGEHAPSLAGSADVESIYLSGHAEAGGVDNRLICNLIHRPRTMDAACD